MSNIMFSYTHTTLAINTKHRLRPFCKGRSEVQFAEQTAQLSVNCPVGRMVRMQD